MVLEIGIFHVSFIYQYYLQKVVKTSNIFKGTTHEKSKLPQEIYFRYFALKITPNYRLNSIETNICCILHLISFCLLLNI